MVTTTRSIKASEFKARCLSLMDEVAASGESLVITKNGQPVARLAPLSRRAPTLIGAHRGAIRFMGDILAPSGERWDSATPAPE